MASVIDALVVTLGLDGEQFKQGVEGAKEKLSGLQEAVGSLMGAFALKEMVGAAKQIFETRKNVEDLSTRIGESVENVSKLTQALKLSEGSGEGMGSVLESLNTKLGQMGGPLGKRAIRPFQNLSKEFTELGLKGKKPVEVFGLIMDKIAGMSPQLAASKLGRMGFDKSMIDFAIQGKDAVAGYIAQSEKLGVLSTENAAKATEFTRVQTVMDITFEKIKGTLATELLPALKAFTEMLTRFGEWAREHPRIVSTAFIAIAAAVGLVSFALGVLAIKAAIAAIAAAPITLIIIAISLAVGLLLAGVYLLYKEWDKWTSGGSSALGELFHILTDVYKLFSESKSMSEFFAKLNEFVEHASAYLAYKFTVASVLIGDVLKKAIKKAWDDAITVSAPKRIKTYDAVTQTTAGRVALNQSGMLGTAALVMRLVDALTTSLSSKGTAGTTGKGSDKGGKKTTIHVSEMNVYPPTADVTGFGTGLQQSFVNDYVLQSEG